MVKVAKMDEKHLWLMFTALLTIHVFVFLNLKIDFRHTKHLPQ